MRVRLAVAVIVALVLGWTVSAQRAVVPGPVIEDPAIRFSVIATQWINGGTLSVVRDHGLPNRPCLYLFQSAYAVQLLPTPSGACH